MVSKILHCSGMVTVTTVWTLSPSGIVRIWPFMRYVLPTAGWYISDDFKSIVYKEMVRVADQYSTDAEKRIYKAAAARFRLPFWDIVMPRNKQSGAVESVWGTPAILAAKNVYVKLPKPTPNAKDGFDTIPNPLYAYQFPTPNEREEARQKSGRRVLQV